MKCKSTNSRLAHQFSLIIIMRRCVFLQRDKDIERLSGQLQQLTVENKAADVHNRDLQLEVMQTSKFCCEFYLQ